MSKFQKALAAWEAKLKSLTEQRDALLQKSVDEGRSFDDAETEAYDLLEGEITAALAQTERLQKAVKEDAAKAKEVRIDPNSAESRAGAVARSITLGSTIEQPSLPKGVEFARFVRCLVQAKNNLPQAAELARQHFSSSPRVERVLKAAVSAGTVTDPSWAGALVDYQNFSGDFIDYLRPQTIVGRFGTGGIPSLVPVPFNVRILSQTGKASAGWVGEGRAKPVTAAAYAPLTLGFAKIAAIAVITEELARFSNPSADMLVRSELASAVIERSDVDFIDPAKAAVTGISPASITNGVVAIPSSDDAETDIRLATAAFIRNNMSLGQGVWIMSEILALQLSQLKGALDQRLYPSITPTGGVLEGIPVITSQYVPEDIMILAAADQIFLADDGTVTVDASNQTSIQMDDAPTQNSGTPTGSNNLVSMWQTNSVAIRAERYINWGKRRTAAVVYISGAEYLPLVPTT